MYLSSTNSYIKFIHLCHIFLKNFTEILAPISSNVPVVYEVSRPVSYLLPVTPYCSNYITDKELVNPYLLPATPYYSLLLLKIDVIFDNISPILTIIAHNVNAKNILADIILIPPNVA